MEFQMKLLTICRLEDHGIPSNPIEATIRLADDAAVDAYLRERFATADSKHCRMRGDVFYNGTGASRIMFSWQERTVRKALPKADGLVFFVQSEQDFKVANESCVPPQPVVEVVA